PPDHTPVCPIPSPRYTPTPPPETYTLSLHDALPISSRCPDRSRSASRRAPSPSSAGPASSSRYCPCASFLVPEVHHRHQTVPFQDRKSTRLNSSHVSISYAVFCLKKKTTKMPRLPMR